MSNLNRTDTLDWSNERYVRLYTRDTKTWMMLGWKGQAVFSSILRKVDRAGVIDDVFDGEDIAVVLANGIPSDIAQDGLDSLIKKGVVEITDSGLVIPNFLEAQEVPMSDAQRQRECRARRRDMARASRNVTVESQNVSRQSHAVTRSHAVSQGVTPSLPSVPSLPSSKKKNDQKTTDKFEDLSVKFLSIFNAVFSRRARNASPTAAKIKSRIQDGVFSEWQILCAPILQFAADPKVSKLNNFSPEMLLRDGKRPRTSSSGQTNGATDWLERVYGIADTLHLDERLTKIADHFGLIDDIKRTGATVTELNNDTATR